MGKIIPNTTQIPNIVLDELLPCLKDVELRVLLIIIRQTLGWVEDRETGRRKEKDWISVHQFEIKTGCKRWAIGKAISSLICMNLIEAYSEDGKLLATPHERQMAGMKIFYRLKTKQSNLFQKQEVSEIHAGVREKEPRTNSRTTKETLSTKDIPLRSEAHQWNQEFFAVCKEITGEMMKETPYDRQRYPRLIRQKFPDIAFLKLAMHYAWNLRRKDGFCYWREGRMTLAKLYHRILPEYQDALKAKENLKILVEMKRTAFIPQP